jgi:hypothetical protein
VVQMSHRRVLFALLAVHTGLAHVVGERDAKLGAWEPAQARRCLARDDRTLFNT